MSSNGDEPVRRTSSSEHPEAIAEREQHERQRHTDGWRQLVEDVQTQVGRHDGLQWSHGTQAAVDRMRMVVGHEVPGFVGLGRLTGAPDGHGPTSIVLLTDTTVVVSPVEPGPGNPRMRWRRVSWLSGGAVNQDVADLGEGQQVHALNDECRRLLAELARRPK